MEAVYQKREAEPTVPRAGAQVLRGASGCSPAYVGETAAKSIRGCWSGLI